MRCRCGRLLNLWQQPDVLIPEQRINWVRYSAQCDVCFHMRHRTPVATCLYCFPPREMAA